jgi:demethylmenaquinone methyltransferase/2-methoxy-6-polyprenyl-1,4-benzoquinol methylase
MSDGVKRLFSEVSNTYKLVNHIITFGMDIRWRRKAVKLATIGGGLKWIDVCTGTGEMAVYLLRLAPEGTEVYTSDFSLPMLMKAKQRKEADRITFVLADSGSLPFPDGFFDLVTISFATRNINTDRKNLAQCFNEFYRVLKPGGRFVNLETSQPTSKIIKILFHLYVRSFVRVAGRIISGSESAYKYLAYTITCFYSAEDLAALIRQAGFSSVTYYRLLNGVTAIHKAIK